MWETPDRWKGLVQLDVGDRKCPEADWHIRCHPYLHLVITPALESGLIFWLPPEEKALPVHHWVVRFLAQHWQGEHRRELQKDKIGRSRTQVPHAGGVLGKGDAKMHARAHMQPAFKGFPWGAGWAGHSFQKRDIKPRQNLLTLCQSWERSWHYSVKWQGSARCTASVGSVSLFLMLCTRYKETSYSLREDFTFPGHMVLSPGKHLLWGA